MNDLNDTIEVSGKPITDELAAEIRARMRDRNFEFVNVMEDIYRMEASHKRYNPIHDYLNGLQYDGGAHIAALSMHFVDRYGVFGIWVRRWLIGAVAKVRDGHQNMVLVLDGPQGIGKSIFSKWLCSGIGKQMFCEQALNLDDKDSYLRLASYLVWEIAEFGQTIRKVDRELFKNFITQSTISVRRAYGKYDIVKPTMASLIGTVNDEVGVLDDPTGSRRFMVTHLYSIDWAYAKDIDVNQVWSEAQAAYLAGEPWQLEGAERDKSQEINALYEVEDPLEGILLRYFRIDLALGNWTSSQEILEKLESNGLKGTSRQNSMALAVVMKRLKCERKRQKNIHGQLVWGYFGVSII
jgi:predicted P-loop ATPase